MTHAILIYYAVWKLLPIGERQNILKGESQCNRQLDCLSGFLEGSDIVTYFDPYCEIHPEAIKLFQAAQDKVRQHEERIWGKLSGTFAEQLQQRAPWRASA